MTATLNFLSRITNEVFESQMQRFATEDLRTAALFRWPRRVEHNPGKRISLHD
jgi:hypothetical protein